MTDPLATATNIVARLAKGVELVDPGQLLSERIYEIDVLPPLCVTLSIIMRVYEKRCDVDVPIILRDHDRAGRTGYLLAENVGHLARMLEIVLISWMATGPNLDLMKWVREALPREPKPALVLGPISHAQVQGISGPVGIVVDPIRLGEAIISLRKMGGNYA